MLIDQIRKELLSPERAQRMAKEMQASYVEHLRTLQTQMTEQPRKLQS